MAWTVMYDVMQWVDANGDPASGYVLKAYLPGTTASTPIAIDSSGSSQQATITFNAEGKPEVSGNEIVPFIDRNYKWAIFANAADAAADSNPFAGFYDNVPQSAVVSTSSSSSYATLAAAVADVSSLTIGQTIFVRERTSGNGGESHWAVVDATTVTENGFDIVTGDVARSFQLVTNKRIDVRSLGVVGDGSTDNSAGIQRAITLLSTTGGTITLSDGTNSDYRVTKQSGTNDKWGININASKITLEIEDGATLRRLNSDISTYALAFPIVLVGVPDSNDIADQVTKVKIKGGEFIGEDTRHSTNGSALMDGRQAVWVKNTKGCTIYGSNFTSIDSSAIWTQSPAEYDYENSQYYNTTKCYNVKVINSDFEAESHSTAGRALIHAINSKADGLKVLHNDFEWCDVCLNCATTYDDYDDVETDTYTDTNLGASVNRTGKNVTINGNTIYNSSEHCFYLNGMSITVTGNIINIDDVATCNVPQFQIRGRNVTATGNTFTGVFAACNINTGSTDVTFNGNTAQIFGDPEGGGIQIRSQGLTAYQDARAWFGTYKPCSNINVQGNTLNFPESSQTYGIGIRIYTDVNDTNFPDGQMQNVNVIGNTVNNAKDMFEIIGSDFKRVKLNNNIINGKPFIESQYGNKGTHDGANNASILTDSGESWTVDEFVGWRIKNLTDGSEATVTANTATTITGTLSGGTDNDWDTSDEWQLVSPQNSNSVLYVDDAIVSALSEVSFDGNKIYGFKHVCYDRGDAGSNMLLPYGFRNNTMDYVEIFSTSAFLTPGWETMFYHNQGRRFLDRDTWFGNRAINNSLSDGTSDSEKKTMLQQVSSSDVRLYYDDDGNFTQLA